jgi:hypothetical protein
VKVFFKKVYCRSLSHFPEETSRKQVRNKLRGKHGWEWQQPYLADLEILQFIFLE